ncbi:MAG: hypothetical protein M3280_02360 [Actinomycetota bacterium]|nr:hypothetical protein [Actinomycetota bacterium]
MVYLWIIIVGAVAGIVRLWLLQRREEKLEVVEDYRTSLQRLANQPLAQPNEPEEPEEKKAPRRLTSSAAAMRRNLAERRAATRRRPRRRVERNPRWRYLGDRRLWRKPAQPWFVMRARPRRVRSAPPAFTFERPQHSWPELLASEHAIEGSLARVPEFSTHHPAPSLGGPRGRRRSSLDATRRDAAKRRLEMRRAGQARV